MIAASPDAWDECAVCGHDREDHDGGRCVVSTSVNGGTVWRRCGCDGFQDGEDR